MGELLITKRVPLLDLCTDNVMTEKMMSQLRLERLIDIGWAKGKTLGAEVHGCQEHMERSRN